MENLFLVVLGLVVVFGLATGLAYLSDWLEDKYPWHDHF
jgi:hypothetical protein